MLIKFKFTLVIVLMFFSTLTLVQAETIKEGTQYQNLDKEVSGVPIVIEFFSFYCGPCYLFAETYNVDKTVSESLPEGVKLTKYHVGVMGALGEELTVAWSIATVLNLEGKVEKLLFERQKSRTLNTVEDIKSVFSELGVSSERYDEMKYRKDVNELTEKQNKAIAEFNVTSTPSFYVLGKYKINNNGVSEKNIEGYPKGLADIIVYLLSK